jgi:hypothetical protein
MTHPNEFNNFSKKSVLHCGFISDKITKVCRYATATGKIDIRRKAKWQNVNCATNPYNPVTRSA